MEAAPECMVCWLAHIRDRQNKIGDQPAGKLLCAEFRPDRWRTTHFMRVNLFDFDLPPERIALRPAEPRDAARLLIVRPHGSPRFEDRAVLDLPVQLAPGDVLAVNDTRVIRAGLYGVRVRGKTSARIEATLMRREGEALWRAYVRPAKKLKQGEVIRFAAVSGMANGAENSRRRGGFKRRRRRRFAEVRCARRDA